MLQNIKKRTEGFTIIEVMIVLAIAGLILLIVFLAIPALQRNSRNTQRKDDVGRIGSAANTILSNNNAAASSVTTASLQTEVGSGKLAYYDNSGTNVSANAPLTATGAGSTLANATTIDTVVVVPNSKCGTVGSTPNSAVYANRQTSVLYAAEGGGGAATRLCVDL